MDHQISEQDIAYDAMATLEEWFRGPMTMSDNRQYRVVQTEHGEHSMVVEVQGTRNLHVVEEQFEIEISVRKVDE